MLTHGFESRHLHHFYGVNVFIKKWLNKDERKQKYRRQRFMTDYSISHKERLVKALISATKETKVINLRDHISPEKNIRIGNFVTCLRREIKHKDCAHDFTYLTNHKSWNDVLVLGDHSFNATEEIKDVVRTAQTRLANDNEDIIINDLKEATSLINHAANIISQAREINKNSEPIIEGINRVAQSVHDTHTEI